MEIIWSSSRSAFCQDEKCSGYLCTVSMTFFGTKRNRLVVWALRALHFDTTKITVVVCALHVVLLERRILLLFVHFARHFKQYEDLLAGLCTSSVGFMVKKSP